MTSFLLLGGSLRSGNRGIHAITLGTMRCLQAFYPQAEFALVSFSSPSAVVSVQQVGLLNQMQALTEATTSARRGAQACLLAAVVQKEMRDPVLSHFVWADVVVDLSFGDGFGETYGFRTLFRHSVGKFLALHLGKPLAVFPQTMGTFGSWPARIVARYLLGRVDLICVREKISQQLVHDLLGPGSEVFCLADMAFLMEKAPTVPSSPVQLTAEKKPIGVNVSGLLWHRGREMYGSSLAFDYPRMIVDLVRRLVQETGEQVILIPHVFSEAARFSDLAACQAAKEALRDVQGNVVVLDGECSAPELKAIIGQCDFFVGSRMHACIAALSTETPVVPISYSHKFAGILERFGIEEWLVDPKVRGHQEAIDLVLAAYAQRNELRDRISTELPLVKADAMQAGQLLKKKLAAQNVAH